MLTLAVQSAKVRQLVGLEDGRSCEMYLQLAGTQNEVYVARIQELSKSAQEELMQIIQRVRRFVRRLAPKLD